VDQVLLRIAFIQARLVVRDVIIVILSTILVNETFTNHLPQRHLVHHGAHLVHHKTLMTLLQLNQLSLFPGNSFKTLSYSSSELGEAPWTAWLMALNQLC